MLQIILLADASSKVWDTRPAEARQADRDARWAERIPARTYVDDLLASPTPRDQLEAAIREDKSITPLRRLVALEVLRDRLKEIDAEAQRSAPKDSPPSTQPAVEQ